MKRTLAGAAILAALLIAPASAQFSNSPPAKPAGAPAGSQMLVPAPGPAIGGGPTYVVPAPQSESVVDVGEAFGPLAPYINSAIGMLITAGIAWIGTLLHKKFNIDIDVGARDALTTFLQRQASSLVADGAVKLTGMKVDVHSDKLAAAANSAITAIPGTLKRFGITPENAGSVLGGMIVDYVHQVPAVAAIAAATKPAAPPDAGIASQSG